MRKLLLFLTACSVLHGAFAETQPMPWLNWDEVTGDWGNARPAIRDHGVDFFGSYTAEIWGNTTGGMRRGAVYTGLLEFGTNIDLEKAIGWKGASFNTTWLWISGGDPSADLVGNFLTVSNIAGYPTLRLCDLWFQQNLFDDKLSIRAGQLTADAEFVISDYGALFINSTLGWPAFIYENVPNGGPGYPMGTLGARITVHPVDWFTFMTGIFQGNVFAENVNQHGFRWRLNDAVGYFWINEAQVRWNHQRGNNGLPGQGKVGFWYDTSDFASIAPDSTKSYQGNYGFYFIIDQMLYREPSPAADDKKNPPAPSSQGFGWFSRLAFSPQDRNFVGFYYDGGFTYLGLIPTRDSDTLGLAFAYAQLSSDAAQTEFDAGNRGVGAEMALEVTYQAQLTNWLSLQPDIQFIINPNGNSGLGNALVVGARVSITF